MVETRETYPSVGLMKWIPLSFGEAKNFLDFLAFNRAPFDVIAVYPSIENMNGFLDFGLSKEKFNIDGNKFAVPIISHYLNIVDSSNETD